MIQCILAKRLAKKRRGSLQNEMLRLEPGKIEFALRYLLFVEAHEGMHLVDVAPYSFRIKAELRDGGIGRAVQKRGFAMLQPPKHVIEQRKPIFPAMADRIVHQFREGTGHGEINGAGRRRRIEQHAAVMADEGRCRRV